MGCRTTKVTTAAAETTGVEETTEPATTTPKAEVESGLKIGQIYEGGTLAYILQQGDPGYVEGEVHGIIAATADINKAYTDVWDNKKLKGGYRWSTGQYAAANDTDYEFQLCNTSTDIGQGSSNTDKILAKYPAGTYPNTAAAVAREYNGGGYSDWFLPSKDELSKLHANKDMIGGFKKNYNYWSSSETESNDAFILPFDLEKLSNNSDLASTKGSLEYVRAIRVFTMQDTTETASTTEPETTLPETTTQPTIENGDYNIGDTGPAGGFIFYINPNYENDGWKYLEAAPSDFLGSKNDFLIQWDYRDQNHPVTGATGTAIGTGMSNTQKIVDIQGSGNYAAKLCDDLMLNGYNDWFMPSKDELNLMYENLYLNGFGGFTYDDYWSSSERDAVSVWFQVFGMGVQYSYVKDDVARVRALRAFASTKTKEVVETTTETTAQPATEKADYNIGDAGPAGGLIFYVNPNYAIDGWKYLEAAISNFPGDNNDYNIPWDKGDHMATGATGTAIGTGKANTQKIVDIQGNGSYAAKLCSDLTQGGYSDWFLPSWDELNLMYENLYLNGLGSFEPSIYWSSSEYGTNNAWDRGFGLGGQYSDRKDFSIRVRAVRAF
jgi:hypothetical protein